MHSSEGAGVTHERLRGWVRVGEPGQLSIVLHP